MSRDSLNPQQRRFVENIMAGNMTLVEAYLSAGYKPSESSKYASASQLFRNIKVQAEIERREEDYKRRGSIRFIKMADGASNTYVNILNSKDTDKKNMKLMELKFKAASDVFDRIGLKPPDKHEHEMKGNQPLVYISHIPDPPEEGNDESSDNS